MTIIKRYLVLICLVEGLTATSSTYALSLNGYTQFSDIYEINTSIRGTVTSINVKLGQIVEKGEALISFNPTPYQAKLDLALSREQSLKPAIGTADIELERAQELFDRDSLSLVNLQIAKDKFAVAEGEYQSAVAETSIAKYNLDNTTIYSPVSAVVVDISTNLKRFENPDTHSKPLISLVSGNKMKAVAILNSEQWSTKLLNKTATVNYKKKKYKGRVSFIGYIRVKQASGLPGFEIHVTFPTKELLPSEMPVTINIQE